MTNIETFYFIDYENVNDAGLACSKQLGRHDHIHIFSTENALKIRMDSLTIFNNADFNTHIIPAGKQSLDMHLVAYLGYLIGKNNPQNCKYIIVSKDNDYNNIISFFKELNSANITRQLKIDSPTKKPTTAKATSTSSKKIPSTQKTQCNTEIQRCISASGYNQTISNTVASIVSKHYGKEHFSNDVHNELRATYTNYIELYQIIKPIIKRYAPDTPSKASTTSQLNAKIQKALSKASYNNNTIAYVASLICKHHDEKNAKQTIYRSIIAKYGQKQGLNIYNHIKNSL